MNVWRSNGLSVEGVAAACAVIALLFTGWQTALLRNSVDQQITQTDILQGTLKEQSTTAVKEARLTSCAKVLIAVPRVLHIMGLGFYEMSEPYDKLSLEGRSIFVTRLPKKIEQSEADVMYENFYLLSFYFPDSDVVSDIRSNFGALHYSYDAYLDIFEHYMGAYRAEAATGRQDDSISERDGLHDLSDKENIADQFASDTLEAEASSVILEVPETSSTEVGEPWPAYLGKRGFLGKVASAAERLNADEDYVDFDGLSEVATRIDIGALLLAYAIEDGEIIAPRELPDRFVKLEAQFNALRDYCATEAGVTF